METTHTPGPWRTGRNPSNLRVMHVQGNGTPVASVHIMVNEREAESEANARLIAAAPDLFECLRIAVEFAVGEPVWLKHARAALAKAEGK